ncbi:hypothetical protein [Nannocystis sp. SCPEA4]|uniref:hypothetical protein n=1 Tax=Nannocystis sp. SCPEA4 TaxID=2996787 RepID=UPI00226F2890|nr:hypothetical protein [Nannocystis sp. SCPEA4]MCY1060754.1 hypothetical protein [Nannocystis sp. SCPEA4]
MSIEKKLSALLATLLFSFAAPIGCGKDEASVCDEGETQACACTNGNMGAQACEDGEWGECSCDGSDPSGGDPSGDPSGDPTTGSDPSGGDPTGSPTSDPTADPTADPTGDDTGDETNVGNPCTAPEDCAGGTICVVQSGDDVQGICTVVCSDWTDCSSSKIGQSFWDCCDLSNGSFACAPDTWECGE